MIRTVGSQALAIKLRCASWAQLAALYRRDLQQSRLYLKASRPPPVGTPIRVSLSLPSGSVLPLQGTVDRMATEADGRGPGVFLRLEELRASNVWLIESALAAARRNEKPGAADSGAPAEEPETAAAERELVFALKEERDALRSLGPFQALGVTPASTDDGVRQAFGQLAKRYHPDRYAQYESEDARSIAAELFILFKEAYAKIATADRRAAMAAKLGLSHEARGEDSDPGFEAFPKSVTYGRSGPASVVRKPSAPLDENFLFEDVDSEPPSTLPPSPQVKDPPSIGKAQQLLDAGRYDEALTVFTHLLRADANHRAARVGQELAHGFKCIAQSDRAAAARHFESALEVDPMNEQAARELAAMRRAATESRKGLLTKLLGRRLPPE